MSIEQARAMQLMTSVASANKMDIESLQLQCTWTSLDKDERANRLMKSLKIEILFVEQKKEVQLINQKGVLAICLPYSELKVAKDVRFNVISLAAKMASFMVGSVLPSQALVKFAELKGVEDGSIAV